MHATHIRLRSPWCAIRSANESGLHGSKRMPGSHSGPGVRLHRFQWFDDLVRSEGGRSRRDRAAVPSFHLSCDAWPGCILLEKRGDSPRGIPFPRSDGGTCRDRPHPCGCEFRSPCARPQCHRGNPGAERRDIPRAHHPTALVLVLRRCGRGAAYALAATPPDVAPSATAKAETVNHVFVIDQTSLRSRP